jgi:phospholipid/cholesterol/gamma-HCH transport system ATP-binding protein
MNAEPVVQVKSLWTVFGDLVVHRDLDLSVMPGEVVSLVGGSGSGKTTLLRQMLGLERPRRGSIRVFGVPLHSCDPNLFKKIRKRWGVLFQHGALYSALSVFDNIALPLRELHGFEEDFIRDIVMLKLDAVGIEHRHASTMPSELSGGMIKRVALARALALDPDIVFLDEPTSGLDPIGAGDFDDLIRTLSRTLGLTVYMVTHDLDSLHSVCDRIAVLADGKVITAGPISTMLASEHPWVKSYFRGKRSRAGHGLTV